jgi:hypothetical protein
VNNELIKIDKVKIINATIMIGLLGITFYPLLFTGFLTADDAERHVAVLDGGMFSELAGIGEATGRITLIFHFFLTHIPYLSDNVFYRKALLIIPHIAVTGFMALTIFNFLHSRSAAIVFFVLFMVFFTNSWEHSLYASYPFAFHVSMLGAISAAYFLQRHIETGLRSYAMVSAAGYGAAIFTYEQFLPYVIFYIGLIFMHHRADRSVPMKVRFLSAFPFILVLAVYLIAVLTFKYSVSGRYEGTEVAIFDPISFVKTLFVFVASSFPTVIPVVYGFFKNVNFGGIPSYGLSWTWLLNNFEIVWVIKAIFASALITVALKKADLCISRKELIRHVSISLTLLLLSVILISASGKYQEWVLNHGAIAYSSSTYFAQLFATATISIVLVWVFSVPSLHGLHKLAVFSVVLVCVLPVTLIIEMHNKNLLASQINSANRWEAIKTMVSTGEFNNIKPGSIIYSPEFMQTGGIVTMREGYWSQYIRAKYGLDIEITGDEKKFYSPEYFGKRYVMEWQSRSPYEYFSARLRQPTGLFIHVPGYEQTGFYGVEKDSDVKEFRWSKKQSSIVICNNDIKTTKMTFSATVLTHTSQDGELKVCHSDKCSNYRLGNIPTGLREEIALLPGCHSIEFTADVPPVSAPMDNRILYFLIKDMSLIELSQCLKK